MTRPPRILMTTDAVGGVWVYATTLARALAGAGCEVTLAVMGPRPSATQLVSAREDGVGIEQTDLALEWTDPEGHDTERARMLLCALAARLRPDVVHLNGYREASLDWPAPVLVVAHSCVTSWWQACRGARPDEARWHAYAEAVARGLAAADVWLAPTAAYRDEIDALYAPPTRGRVIHNGVDGGALPANAPKEPFILAAGRLWDEAKNLRGLDDIAGEVDWPIRVAGPLDDPTGPARPRRACAVDCLGSLERPDLLALMRRAGVFAAPALYEPFGLSVLEAASCGCALLLADIPSLRELWGQAALFVDPRDGDAQVEGLQALCRDDSLRKSLQRAARARAARYSVAEMTLGYLELYEEMRGATPAALRASAALELHG